MSQPSTPTGKRGRVEGSMDTVEDPARVLLRFSRSPSAAVAGSIVAGEAGTLPVNTTPQPAKRKRRLLADEDAAAASAAPALGVVHVAPDTSPAATPNGTSRHKPAKRSIEEEVASSLADMSNKASRHGSPVVNAPSTPSSAKKKRSRQSPASAKPKKSPATKRTRTPKAAGTSSRPSTPGRGTPKKETELREPVVLSMSKMATGRQVSNALKNQKFARWCLCEWFYSPIDKAILSSDETGFTAALQASFPQASRCESLRGFEWFYIKRNIGKPRRFSKKFVDQQRHMLECQRICIRELQGGSNALRYPVRLPSDIPLQLCVGQRVIARAHGVKGLLFPGFVLAIVPETNEYRVCFDRKDIGVRSVPDVDVAPMEPTQTQPLKTLLQEKLHVPSAGIDRSIKTRRTPVDEKLPTKGFNMFSKAAEVAATAPQDQATRTYVTPGLPLEGFLGEMGRILARAKQEISQQMPPSNTRLWTHADVLLIDCYSRLLNLKEVLLKEQASLTQLAQQTLGQVPDSLRSQYNWVVARLAEVQVILDDCHAQLVERSSGDIDQQVEPVLPGPAARRQVLLRWARTQSAKTIQTVSAGFVPQPVDLTSPLNVAACESGAVLYALQESLSLRSTPQASAESVAVMLDPIIASLKAKHPANTPLVEKVQLLLSDLQSMITGFAPTAT
eukprot:m.203001 g.203001  ORF g.203001 m.203001 type:complete len:675 (+) comp18446_c1_seq2:328-2352(+)